ncbi:MAG TPA: RHS repeat-associated core domain-containing protein [Candidatus Didemnitutus sp.]|nr:RHS repeat-associated core domain-containing protein [Candidatus Didemnitutus sp.]
MTYFNLIERFTKRKDAEPIAGGEGCLPDAATAPLDDFRYRFGPLQEREQKRQYSTSQNQAIAGLMWNYTLLGADAKQLASYNGVQGGFCGQVANTVWIWPVEYNSYGPAQTRIITRPQGAKEFVIADHLGSTRLTLNQTGDILERLDYQPFGKEINEAGEGARTSYIGREKDTESELGFYGVRMYEPEYGRFMSVDPLWDEFGHLTPYHYCGNSPLVQSDPSGEFPWGVVIGAAVEVASQMYFEDKSLSEIDVSRVLVAAVAGGFTGGVSSLSSVPLKVGATAAISVLEGAAKRGLEGKENTASDVALDATLGIVGGVASEGLAKRALASSEGKALKETLRREENVLEGGRTRASQVAAVNGAREAVANVGRGGKEDALVSGGKETIQRMLNVPSTSFRRDNTNTRTAAVRDKTSVAPVVR